MLLYEAPGSPYAQKIKIALREKGVAFDLEWPDSLGTERELTTNRARVAMFVLINVAAITRVCASWHTDDMMILLGLSATCWIAAFGLFEIVYGPMLLTRQPARSDPPP